MMFAGYIICMQLTVLMDIPHVAEADWMKVVFAIFLGLGFMILTYMNCSIATLKAIRKSSMVQYRNDGKDERFIWLRDIMTKKINRRNQ